MAPVLLTVVPQDYLTLCVSVCLANEDVTRVLGFLSHFIMQELKEQLLTSWQNQRFV